MDLAKAALEGSQRAGARLIRLLEEEDPAGIEGLKRLYPHSGRAYLLGVTGPPGTGKSTLVDGMIGELRKRGKRVGVILVDPSSPFSGGAVLGDRVRMQRHATDGDVFIRSMATRGQVGGLGRTTFETSVVLDAMGFEVILVETVGVGQDELEVAELAHTTVVVGMPGTGDAIQAMKAGILEIGDLFVLNKADRSGADEAEAQLLEMIHVRRSEPGQWTPRLLRTVATRGSGIVDLVDACRAHQEHLVGAGRLGVKTERRDFRFFLDLLRRRAGEKILRAADESSARRALLADLRARRIDPYTAAERLLESFPGGS